jgi:hypothetical protein
VTAARRGPLARGRPQQGAAHRHQRDELRGLPGDAAERHGDDVERHRGHQHAQGGRGRQRHLGQADLHRVASSQEEQFEGVAGALLGQQVSRNGQTGHKGQRHQPHGEEAEERQARRLGVIHHGDQADAGQQQADHRQADPLVVEPGPPGQAAQVAPQQQPDEPQPVHGETPLARFAVRTLQTMAPATRCCKPRRAGAPRIARRGAILWRGKLDWVAGGVTFTQPCGRVPPTMGIRPCPQPLQLAIL